MQLFTVAIVALALASSSNAFHFSSIRGTISGNQRNTLHPLPMSDEAGPDPLDAVRAKMEADANYNPMQDPEAIAVIEKLIPTELKEFGNSFERLKVAFADATTGTEAVDDLDSVATSFSNKKDLISSPASKWGKGGLGEDAEEPFDEAKLNSLFDKLRSENPDVPFED